ncbi:hypothetical protein [Flaviflexus salsibiostraticola]|nr:hypothetical protein [Flaviflexus salsibiostraticola]
MESVCANARFRYENQPCIVGAIIAGVEQAMMARRGSERAEV